MSKSTENLIREIMHLYAKYGAVTFDKALEEIRAGYVSKIIDQPLMLIASKISSDEKLLKSGEHRSSKKNIKSQQSLPINIPSYLQNLTPHDDARMYDFIVSLIENKPLRPLNFLKKYAINIGVVLPAAIMTRDDLIKVIAEYLFSISGAEREEKIKIAEEVPQKKSSLGAWTKIIVKDSEK